MIRPPQGLFSFDVHEILRCLGRRIEDYAWLITELDCTGNEAQSLCDAVESQRGRGLVLSANGFLAALKGFQQTIEAKILGLPKKDYGPEELALLGDLGAFPETEAQLAILAIDGTYFEVMTKDDSRIQSITQCFKEVPEEDGKNYFCTPRER